MPMPIAPLRHLVQIEYQLVDVLECYIGVGRFIGGVWVPIRMGIYDNNYHVDNLCLRPKDQSLLQTADMGFGADLHYLVWIKCN